MDWTVPRQGRYRFFRVDYQTRLEVEELTTVMRGGSIVRNMNTTLKESGTLPMASPPAFGDDLVRIYYVAEDEAGNTETVALATMHAVAENESLGAAHRESSLRLFSALLTLDEDFLKTTLTLPAGTNALDAAAAIVTGRGLPLVKTPKVKGLGADVSFDIGTPYLSVVNYLLEYAGYWSAQVDGWGRVVFMPYQEPATRGRSWLFEDGATCTFLPNVSKSTDSFKVPNQYTLVKSNGVDEVLVGTFTNDDPASPFSTVSRGRVIAALDFVNDALDEADLYQRARMRLMSATSASEVLKLQHSYAPVGLGDVVGARWRLHDIDLDGSIQSQELKLTPSCLTTTTLKRIWR